MKINLVEIKKTELNIMTKGNTCTTDDDERCDAYRGGYCLLFGERITDYVDSKKYSAVMLSKRLKECKEYFKTNKKPHDFLVEVE